MACRRKAVGEGEGGGGAGREGREGVGDGAGDAAGEAAEGGGGAGLRLRAGGASWKEAVLLAGRELGTGGGAAMSRALMCAASLSSSTLSRPPPPPFPGPWPWARPAGTLWLGVGWPCRGMPAETVIGQVSACVSACVCTMKAGGTPGDTAGARPRPPCSRRSARSHASLSCACRAWH